jgi:hypothetical protein
LIAAVALRAASVARSADWAASPAATFASLIAVPVAAFGVTAPLAAPGARRFARREAVAARGFEALETAGLALEAPLFAGGNDIPPSLRFRHAWSGQSMLLRGSGPDHPLFTEPP